MKTLPLKNLLQNLSFAALLGVLPPALSAQSAPLAAPTAPVSDSALAAMNEDVQTLQREMGELRLQVESLQQANDDLKKQMLSDEEVKTTVENMIAASRAEINKDITKTVGVATDEERKGIMIEVAKQMKVLADDTNAQLEKLAHAIGNAPAPRPISVNSGPPPKFDKGIDYVVKHGDTLAKICLGNHVSSRELLLANPQLNGNGNIIREGEHLFIPQKEGGPAPGLALAPLPASTADSGN